MNTLSVSTLLQGLNIALHESELTGDADQIINNLLRPSQLISNYLPRNIVYDYNA